MSLKRHWQQLAQKLVRRYRKLMRTTKNARDLERINAAADRLNLEAAEVLDYQASDSGGPWKRR